MEFLSGLAQRILPSNIKSPVPLKGPVSVKWKPTKQNVNDEKALMYQYNKQKSIDEYFGSSKKVATPRVTSVPRPVMTSKPTISPKLTVTPTPQSSPYADKIKKGFIKYGGESLPVATLSAAFARESEKYPILRKYPYLLPSIALKETSGGKRQAFKHNPMNYGIYLQKTGAFNPQSPEEVIEKTARAIGSGNLYRKFQSSGDLNDFLNTYAPPTENDTRKYNQDLQYFFNLFQ